MKIQSDKFTVGIDIGGSHITAALVNVNNCAIEPGSIIRSRVDSSASAKEILNCWLQTIKSVKGNQPYKVAIAMPGPFDYENGICLIKDLHKYESLYGVNVKLFLSENLGLSSKDICFRNDAEGFLAGEVKANNYSPFANTLGITLGTGLGSAISNSGITKDANFAITPFYNGIAEDYISTRWFVARFLQLTGKLVSDVKDMLLQESYKEIIDQIFDEFTSNLTAFLTPVIMQHEIETIVIGGNIAKTADRFLNKLLLNLCKVNEVVNIQLANLGESSAMIGASLLFEQPEKVKIN